MRKLVNILIIASMIMGIVSCKKEEPVNDLTLSKTVLELKKDETTIINIQNGNGEYTVKMSNDKIAKAILSGNTVTVSAVGVGSSTITISDGKRQSAIITIKVSHNVDAANMISFNVADTDGPKEGNIGFLHSVNLTAPVDSFITLIKPKLWRLGRYNDAFSLYHRLKGLGVERQLLALSDLRTEAPYRTVFQEQGYGAMATAILEDTKALGLDFEYDIYNEPNRMANFDLSTFMTELWIPAYRAIKEANPNAIIHGPSTSINSFGTPQADSLVLFQFLDEAMASNTVPDYINWHLQIGYNMADWHKDYADKIKSYLESKGFSILGAVVGETIRTGDERNTSPAVLIDMFAAAEVSKIPQIHAAWSSTPVYGVSTSIPPVLCGILTGTTGEGRRGAWWTYRFFADTEGLRVKCEDSPTGSQNLVGLTYKDEHKKVLRSLVGLRDTKKKQNALITFNNLQTSPYIATNGKTRVKMWYNHQTRDAVEAFGSESLPLIMDEVVEIVDNKIEIPVTIDEWDAVLIELSSSL